MEPGGVSRIRTGDPLLAKQVLYQLSYNPAWCALNVRTLNGGTVSLARTGRGAPEPFNA